MVLAELFRRTATSVQKSHTSVAGIYTKVLTGARSNTFRNVLSGVKVCEVALVCKVVTLDDSLTAVRPIKKPTCVHPQMNKSMQLSWDDGERIFCRELRANAGSDSPVLIARPAAEQPLPACLGRLAHEFGLKDELNRTWAVQPLEMLRATVQFTLPGPRINT